MAVFDPLSTIRRRLPTGQKRKRCDAAALIFLAVFAFAEATLAWSSEMPDPCKLLSTKEIRRTLGLGEPVSMMRIAWAPPEWAGENAEVYLSNPTLFLSSPRRESDLICEAISGDVTIAIRVRTVEQARADGEQNRKQFEQERKKWRYKNEVTTYGGTTCEKILGPASDLLGLERDENDIRVETVRCFVTHGDYQLSIKVFPWVPKKDPLLSLDKLSVLVATAASRL